MAVLTTAVLTMAALDTVQVAIKQKLDLTDAFEEAAGKGRDASVGLMAKNRFATCLGLMFKGEVTKEAIGAICSAYGAGDPDPREPGTFTQVQFKEFALDFDNLVIPPEREPTGLELMSEAQRQEMTRLRVAARNKKLDLTDAFSEYAGTGMEANCGRMAKSRFQCAMGTIFNGIDLKRDVLIAICEAYATGDPDPSEEGGHMKVRWKQFAIDFDDFPMPLKVRVRVRVRVRIRVRLRARVRRLPHAAQGALTLTLAVSLTLTLTPTLTLTLALTLT